MSSISSRPRVKSVKTSLMSKNAIATTAQIIKSIASMVDEMSVQAQEAFHDVAVILPEIDQESIKSIFELRQDYAKYNNQIKTKLSEYSLPKIEAQKLTSLLSIAVTPFVADLPTIKSNLDTISTAQTETAIKSAHQNALFKLEQCNQTIMMNTLALACTNAANKVGFANVSTFIQSDKMVRHIASDKEGRSIVTEITTVNNGDIKLETEIVGMSDGSCIEILNAFDTALEKEGIRSIPTKRKYTGGVCELATSREFVRKNVIKKPISSMNTNSRFNQNKRRTQKLNQQVKQINKYR